MLHFLLILLECKMRDQAVARILDANLDRAREGLRVLEDWFRFGLDEPEWVTQCKDMRQELASWHRDPLRWARDTEGDQGTHLSHPQERTRQDLKQLLQANCARIQEALRVVEEYSKLPQAQAWIGVEVSEQAKQMRYRIYEMDRYLFSRSLTHRLAASSLCLLTSPAPDWLTQVEVFLQGGGSMVQYCYRTHSESESPHRPLPLDPDSVILQELIQLHQICDSYQALLIVQHRVDLTLLAEAEGVYLDPYDVPVESARSLMGSHKLIGQMISSSQQDMNREVDYGMVLDHPVAFLSKTLIPWIHRGDLSKTTRWAGRFAAVSNIRSLLSES
jgi:thiamine-phosphate pyrophosphorylase